MSQPLIGKVSMSKAARYVTQQGIWSQHVLGRLTDRKIAKYQAQGYYGPDAQNVRQTAAKQKRNRRRLMAGLFKDFL